MFKLPVRTWILNAAAVFSGQHGAGLLPDPAPPVCRVGLDLGQEAAGEGFVAVPGGKVWYRIMGSGTHTPLLMLHNDFVAPSINIDNLDPGAEGYPIARQRIDNAGLQTVMSNSFGFGGTNACLLFSRYDH